jgi:hypothetical protein
MRSEKHFFPLESLSLSIKRPSIRQILDLPLTLTTPYIKETFVEYYKDLFYFGSKLRKIKSYLTLASVYI